MKHRPLWKLGLSLTLAVVATTAAHAQILWTSTGTITNDLDVLTNGIYFDATQLQYNHTVSETVNGVVFKAFDNSTTDGTISTSGHGDGTDSYSGSLSASYQAILTGTSYASSPTSETVTIGSVADPLTIGNEYQVQIWLGANNNRQTVYSGVTPLKLTGADYGIGTFTATSSTMSFTLTAVSPNTAGEIDAISVRDIPEPSTWAMMLGGVALLGLLLFRARAKRPECPPAFRAQRG